MLAGIESVDEAILVLEVFTPSPAFVSDERMAEFVEAAAVAEESEAVENAEVDVVPLVCWYTLRYSIPQYASVKLVGLFATKSIQDVYPDAPVVMGHEVPPYKFPA